LSSSKTLDALKGLQPGEVERRLASAIQSLLPKPGEEVADDTTSELLNQTRQRIQQSGRGALGDSKVFEFLTNELKLAVVSDEKRVRARLGQRGDLAPYLYHAEFQPAFRETQKRGIRRSHVEAALARPDVVQHVMPPVAEPRKFPALSLYGKYQNGNRFNSHALIVETERRGDAQLVATAWRVYPSDVDISKAESPLDILRAFINTYGMEFRVFGEGGKVKFVYYQAFTPPPGKEQEILKLEHPPKQGRGEAHAMVAHNKLSGLVEVALAYVINTSQYGEDLRKHGVTVEL
jgi:hypothetical protein